MPTVDQTTPAPPTRREPIVETIHGVDIADPYRWLEDGASPEVRAWTAAQNARTEALLSSVPGRPGLETRLTDLFRAASLGAPERRGRRIFYTRREGDQAQAILYWRDGLDGDERVLIDPNRLDAR